MAWDTNLNPESAAYSIAASENERIRVVAGPGTGKSFAMKRRVARLLESGVDASSILPVTFTRVAAEDLHRELIAMDTLGAERLSSLTTIIAACVEGVLPGRPNENFTDAQKLAHFEEQRRLFFVGITRVKSSPLDGEPGRLFLTYSRRMAAADARQSGIQPAAFDYGEAVMNASRFLRELGPSAPEREAG